MGTENFTHPPKFKLPHILTATLHQPLDKVLPSEETRASTASRTSPETKIPLKNF
jgi:hypothetical protein